MPKNIGTRNLHGNASATQSRESEDYDNQDPGGSSFHASNGKNAATQLAAFMSMQMLTGGYPAGRGYAGLDSHSVCSTASGSNNGDITNIPNPSNSHLNSGSSSSNTVSNSSSLLKSLGVPALSFGAHNPCGLSPGFLSGGTNDFSIGGNHADSAIPEAPNQAVLNYLQQQQNQGLMPLFSHLPVHSYPSNPSLLTPHQLDMLHIYRVQQLLATQQQLLPQHNHQQWQLPVQQQLPLLYPYNSVDSMASRRMLDDSVKDLSKYSLPPQSSANVRKRRYDDSDKIVSRDISQKCTKPPPRKQKAEQISKYKGVTWHKRDQKWMARVWIPKLGRVRYLGTFFSEKAAADAIMKTNQEIKDGVDYSDRGTRRSWSRLSNHKEAAVLAANRASSSNSSSTSLSPSHSCAYPTPSDSDTFFESERRIKANFPQAEESGNTRYYEDDDEKKRSKANNSVGHPKCD